MAYIEPTPNGNPNPKWVIWLIVGVIVGLLIVVFTGLYLSVQINFSPPVIWERWLVASGYVLGKALRLDVAGLPEKVSLYELSVAGGGLTFC